jgi:hypothetical protein
MSRVNASADDSRSYRRNTETGDSEESSFLSITSLNTLDDLIDAIDYFKRVLKVKIKESVGMVVDERHVTFSCCR